MNTNQINYLNIGLMILSCIVAFIMPFELFLFSYAILGPLHYLTEISWLHKRQYFSPGKRDYIILGALAMLISIPNMFPHFYDMLGPKDTEGKPIHTEEMVNFVTTMGHAMPFFAFVAFAGSALMIMAKDTRKRIIGFILIIVVGYMFHTERIAYFALVVFLPTLVHVFIFTGAFILLGALKSKSLSGILSLVVFIACGASLFILFPHTITAPGTYAAKVYDNSFIVYNQQIFDALLHRTANRDTIYSSTVGVMIARFIGFAYTYHYLNWFSKTSVIKWHLVKRKSLLIIFGIWALSVILYLTDYRTGIMALYFLSYLHVIFEFPLNFHSFKDIGKEVRGRLRPQTQKIQQ
jgi:hypothetical protein